MSILRPLELLLLRLRRFITEGEYGAAITWLCHEATIRHRQDSLDHLLNGAVRRIPPLERQIDFVATLAAAESESDPKPA